MVAFQPPPPVEVAAILTGPVGVVTTDRKRTVKWEDRRARFGTSCPSLAALRKT